MPPKLMDPLSQQPLEEMEKVLRLHDQMTAPIRAKLAQRTAAQVMFDECLLEQLRKGKPFRTALRKANAQFPSEALDASALELAAVERRYRSFLELEDIDAQRRKLEQLQHKIKDIDEKIATVIDEAIEGTAGEGATDGTTGPQDKSS